MHFSAICMLHYSCSLMLVSHPSCCTLASILSYISGLSTACRVRDHSRCATSRK